ncbi:MAG: Rieske (2Fe-2S) protein [Thaumarchaeota archaeon]|nr:Rieske (2Fe-2S) protein [Nitrososphaerota archaeon]
MTWMKLCSREIVSIGKGKEFVINGKRIAIFNIDGDYYATEALCRHQDGPLASGTLKGEIVECPWHFWHYNVKTGELLDYLNGVKLDKYSIEVRDNDVYIDV